MKTPDFVRSRVYVYLFRNIMLSGFTMYSLHIFQTPSPNYIHYELKLEFLFDLGLLFFDGCGLSGPTLLIKILSDSLLSSYYSVLLYVQYRFNSRHVRDGLQNLMSVSKYFSILQKFLFLRKFESKIPFVDKILFLLITPSHLTPYVLVKDVCEGYPFTVKRYTCKIVIVTQRSLPTFF